MITKNIIISQIADYHNFEPKPVRGLITLTGEGNMTGLLRVFNVPRDILPVTLAIKIGEKKFVYHDVEEPQDYNFKIVGAPANENITVLLAYTTNGYVQGIASGHNAGGSDTFSDLFSEISDTELDAVIDNELDKQDLQTLAEAPIEPEPLPEEKQDFVEQNKNFK